MLARDPLREEAHSVLIAAYGRSGTRSQVVRQYRRLCEVLRTELAVAPLPETDATYRTALANTIRRSQDRAAAMAADPAARGARRVFDRSTLARVLSPEHLSAVAAQTSEPPATPGARSCCGVT